MVNQFFPAQQGALYRYVDLLTTVGVDHGLLGPRETDRIWSRHILNCAVIAPLLVADSLLCDLGSGAGLPGIVLALARPDVRFTLLEPLLRRASFLDIVATELGLDNVVVRRGRAEEMRADPPFDSVTARAVAPLERLVGLALPLLRCGGELLAFKGHSAADEVAAASPTLARLGARQVWIETCGLGIVDPATTLVRIESSGAARRTAKGR